MRYCLSCRRLSGNPPRCTSCGRSFGGCLCTNKKCRFLNPPQSQVCGQCGETTLIESTHSLGLFGYGRVFLWIRVLLIISWLGTHVFAWVLHIFQAHTGYHDPFVWLFDKTANVFIVVMTFYLLSAFIPGEVGQMFRKWMNTFFNSLLKLVFSALNWALRILCKGVAAVFLPSKDMKS